MEANNRLAPPYVSYHNFELLLAQVWQNGLPDELDREGLAPVPEKAHKHLRAALRFLGLMDDASRPTPMFERIAAATTANARREALGDIVNEAYGALRALSLDSMGREALQAEFEKHYQTTRETTRKSAGFFIQIARAGGFELNHELVRRMGAAPSLGSGNAACGASPPERSGNLSRGAIGGVQPLAHEQYQFLVDLIDLERMGAEELKAALVLMKFVRQGERALSNVS